MGKEKELDDRVLEWLEHGEIPSDDRKASDNRPIGLPCEYDALETGGICFGTPNELGSCTRNPLNCQNYAAPVK